MFLEVVLALTKVVIIYLKAKLGKSCKMDINLMLFTIFQLSYQKIFQNQKAIIFS